LPLLIPIDKTGSHLPPGYAVKIPANAAVVFQTHYVNASSAQITTHDEIDLDFVADGPQVTKVNTWLTSTLGFNLPAAQKTTVALNCIAPTDMNAFSAFGHMHELGRRVTLEVGPDDAHLQTIYDIENWTV